jgi:transcriptional regulator with XRE-family HTH domain
MSDYKSTSQSTSPVGSLLQHWRQLRRKSQLALAIEADVSPRHVCFVETGRAQPSREMVLQLASALDVPFRERNALLLAAGYAPIYRETPLDSPELGGARTALDAILRQQEPFPAVVMNRRWDVLTSNSAASRFFSWLLAPSPLPEAANVIRLMFDPNGLRPFVVNWEAVAESLIRRVHRETVAGVIDEAALRLLDEVFAFPDVPRHWRRPRPDTPLTPILPVTFAKGDAVFDYFSTVTTLGTPQDITLQELRIECFFPLNTETEHRARELAAGK